jgi:hypothetical protein
MLDEERRALEADLEIAVEAPRAPSAASSPRMFAHTMRRAPSPDGAPTARGSSEQRAAPIDRGDISTIEMPRVERSPASDPDPFAISDDDLTRQLRHRFEERRAFDDSVPPAEDDFEADCAILDLPLPAPPQTELRPPPVAQDMAPADPFAYDPVAQPSDFAPPPTVVQPPAVAHARISARTLRVLVITLAILVAAVGGFLLTYSGLVTGTTPSAER